MYIYSTLVSLIQCKNQIMFRHAKLGPGSGSCYGWQGGLGGSEIEDNNDEAVTGLYKTCKVSW